VRDLTQLWDIAHILSERLLGNVLEMFAEPNQILIEKSL
jgi:hypothetical protein